MKQTPRDDHHTDAVPVGLYHISYYLPREAVSLDELVRMNVLTRDQMTLYRESRGLNAVHIAEDETANDIAVRVAHQALVESDTDPKSIDAVIHFHSMYNAKLPGTAPVQRIRYELGLKEAVGFSIWGQACTSVTSAVRVARSMIRAGSAETVLLVGADSLVGSRNREIEGMTLMGDGGSAVVVRKNCSTNRLMEIANYDDGSFYRCEIAEGGDFDRFTLLYFMATTRLVERTLKRARLTLDDISLIIPHNINTSSWELVMNMLKCDEQKLFGDNILRHGHAFGSDVLVNLADAIKEGRIEKGEYALLLTAGMGACWGSMLIQH